MSLWTEIWRPRDGRSDAAGVLAPALVLVGIGLVFAYSAGAYAVGARAAEDAAFHLKRQALWSAFGLLACGLAATISLGRWRSAAPTLLGCTAFLLLCALLFAPDIANTKRWIPLPVIGRFQPSELAKIALVLWLARALAERGTQAGPLLPLLAPPGIVCLLVVLAPDFGTAVYLLGIVAALLFVSGLRLGRLVTGAAAGLLVLLLVASHFPHIAERLRFFRGETPYQVEQATIAVASGGWVGQGLGAGRQKLGFLPASHNDFILPVVGEELGFLGIALVAALFIWILIHGLRVAVGVRERDPFGFYVALGATLVVVLQAFLNVAVSTGAAPPKGISLPFVSVGGSNLIISLVAVGLIVNVGRRGAAET